jgi:hypothetical protein
LEYRAFFSIQNHVVWGIKEVREKGLDILLVAVFGMGGIAILLLALVLPMAASERILTILVGLIGLTWALVRAVSLVSKQIHARQSHQ